MGSGFFTSQSHQAGEAHVNRSKLGLILSGLGSLATITKVIARGPERLRVRLETNAVAFA